MQKRERVILHSDLNNFFASVECALNPALKGKPLIVCGDPKLRHGVVLAKNEESKALGIKTGDTVYSALKVCPNLQMVKSNHLEYARYSAMVKDIYARFTEQIEERSMDECAMDVTESIQLFGSGEEIAHKIRQAVKEELGLTVSIGVSFNKVFDEFFNPPHHLFLLIRFPGTKLNQCCHRCRINKRKHLWVFLF